MQKLQSANNSQTSPEQCAEQLLEVIPAVMRRIRLLMRERRADDLSVPQFRALGYIYRHPQTSLSTVAEHVGLSVPAASRLVDTLVSRHLVERGVSAADRRQISLRLSERGSDVWARSRQHARSELAAIVATLSESERSDIVRALWPLREMFATRGDDATAGGHREHAEHQAPLKGSS